MSYRKSINRKLFIIFILQVITLAIGCQDNDPAPAIEVFDAAYPATLVESPTPHMEPSARSVPQGKPATIDGTMSPGEWNEALIESFADGSELFLMYSDSYLYLGVRANTEEMIIGNIFIDRGNEIAIYHASAALGTALYEKVEGGWQQTQNFKWCCRKTENREAAQAERDTFLSQEHWVATNARMGTPNELEYQIEVTGATLRLAVNFLKSSDPNVKIPWPIDLKDDTIRPTPGGLPVQLYFSPYTWATIRLPNQVSSLTESR